MVQGRKKPFMKTHLSKYASVPSQSRPANKCGTLFYCFLKVTPDTEMNYWESSCHLPKPHHWHRKNYDCHASHPAGRVALQKRRKASHQTQNETQSQATPVERSWPLAECSDSEQRETSLPAPGTRLWAFAPRLVLRN